MSDVRSVINLMIMTSCVLYVLLQTHNCLVKYTSEPQATIVNVGLSKRYVQPDVTLCVAEDEILAGKYFNKTVLDQCNIG